MPKLKSAKIIVPTALIAASIAIAVVFQNCGSSQMPSGYNTSPSTAATCLVVSPLAWAVNAVNCTAVYTGPATIADAQTINISTATNATNIGSASFTCSGGALLPSPTNTCTVNSSGAVNGVCGTDNNKTISAAPTTNAELCSVGQPTAVAGTGPWTWSCSGLNSGSSVNCTAQLTATNGVCGPANGTDVSAAPTAAAQLCQSGSASAVAGTGPFTWSCTGGPGGTSQNCTANLIVNGACGTANGQFLSAVPATASQLCAVGTATPVTGGATGPTWAWNCDGANTGTNPPCSATYAPASLVKTCTFSPYPAGAGFLLATANNSLGNICCEIDTNVGATAASSGDTLNCTQPGVLVTPNGPANKLATGSACSFTKTTLYPTGGGVITYTEAGGELCCSVGTYNPNNDGNLLYCEPTTVTHSVVTTGVATQAGAPCNMPAYTNGYGITLYTTGKVRVCCSVGAGDNGPGGAKSLRCDPY